MYNCKLGVSEDVPRWWFNIGSGVSSWNILGILVGCKIGNALLSFLFQDLADDEEDMACFCGGLGKFSEMLINVKGLLCEAEEFHDQDHDDGSLLGAAAPSLESSSDSGVLDLFEGNHATQNEVCTLRWGHQVETIVKLQL